MDNEQVIATLNNLLAITKDGERGFRTCAGGVTSPDLKMEPLVFFPRFLG